MTFNPRLVVATVLAASGLLVAACGGPDQPTAQVPTLPGSTAPSGSNSSATSASTDPGQPRERLDMTNDDIDALYTVYSQCMAANGWDKSKNGADQAAMDKAANACKSKDPLPPWELDASNPHGADFVHAVVQCLRGKGVKYVQESPPQGGRWTFAFGGDNNDPDSISKGLEYTPDCEKQVAAQGIGR